MFLRNWRGKGFDRRYKCVKRCFKCGADFHDTSSIPDIPGWQRWITARPDRGGPVSLTDGRKGEGPELTASYPGGSLKPRPPLPAQAHLAAGTRPR